LKPLQMVVLLQASLVPLPSHLQLKQWVYEIEWCHDGFIQVTKETFFSDYIIAKASGSLWYATHKYNFTYILSSWVEAYLVTQTTETPIEKAVDDLPLCVMEYTVSSSWHSVSDLDCFEDLCNFSCGSSTSLLWSLIWWGICRYWDLQRWCWRPTSTQVNSKMKWRHLEVKMFCFSPFSLSALLLEDVHCVRVGAIRQPVYVFTYSLGWQLVEALNLKP
jgi:hypothetical protein